MPRRVLGRFQLQLGDRSRTAVRKLEEQEIGVPDKPADKMPGLPRDVTDLSEPDLMERFSEMTGWVNFLGTQLASAIVDEESAKSVLDKIRAIGAVRNRSEKTVTAAKARVYEDDDFNEAHEAYEALYAYRKLIESRYNAADRNSAVLSRELTRRTSRSDRENRNRRYNP